MITARHIRKEDQQACWQLALAMHAESYYRDYDINKRKFNLIFEAATTNLNYFSRVFVDSKTDEPCGFFLTFVSEHYFGYDKVAMDLGMYMNVENRGKGGLALARVIKQYEKWAKALGCQETTLAVSAGITDELSQKLFEKRGYLKSSSVLHKKVH